MKKNLFKIFALLFAMGLFVVACDDVNLTDTDVDTETATDAATASKVAGEISDFVDAGIATVKSASSCPGNTYTPSTKTLTVDFGDGCVGGDGITRKGLITAVFTGSVMGWEANETATITFTDYYRNNQQLEGEIVITCTSLDPLTFNVVASNMALNFTDGTSINWASNETIKLESSDEAGKSWRFNGGTVGTCTTRNNVEFSRTSTDLLSSPTCRWFVDGVFEFSVGENTTKITFLSECGKVKAKRNNLPEIEINLN